MTPFDNAWGKLLGVEGDFSNNKVDRGGATRWGITEAVARAAGYAGPMNALPLDQAKAIAKIQYWDVVWGDKLVTLSFSVAYELMDTGYNMGTGTAIRFLQRCLNVFNKQQMAYGDLRADGAMGFRTFAAIQSFLSGRGALGEVVLLRALNSLQGSGYIAIAENDATQEAFVFGQIANRVVI